VEDFYAGPVASALGRCVFESCLRTVVGFWPAILQYQGYLLRSADTVHTS